jgi:hypothetical protein
MVCRIMEWDSDGTLEHEEGFEGGRRIVYKETVVGVGGFPFLLSLLIFLYSNASYNFKTAWTRVFCWFSRYEFRAPFVLPSKSHLSYQYHLRLTPPVTLERVLQYRTCYWMCLHPSTGCKYCSKPCSLACWVYLAPNYRWIHNCDNCADELLRLTGFDIRQYPYRSPYWNAPIR